MKNQMLLRGLFGFPIGIAIGNMISIIISAIIGDSGFHFCAPSLIEFMSGNAFNAALFQFILSGILGSVFAASSVIWDLDHWSFSKQTGTYFLITACAMMPIAYVTHWMEHSLSGFVSYFLIFVVIFFITWIIQYLFWRKKIRQLNQKVGR